MAALINSFVPSSAHIVGGQFNATPPVLTDGQCSVFELDASGNLKVNMVAGGGSGSNAAAGPTGSPVPADADYQGVNIGGILTGVTGLALGATTKAPTVAIVDGSGNQITSFGGGTQYADGTTQATPTGTVALGKNPSNILHSLSLDASGNLNVNLNANSFGTVTVTGTVTANQGGAPWSVDVTDRAARLLGVVYGSQGQQLKQTATNFNLQVELATGGTLYDARQIRALTSADVVTAAQGTAAALSGAWPVEVTDGTNVLGISAHPLRVDPTGTTTQPVSGSVSVSNFPATQNVAGTTTDGTTTETNFLVVGGESNDATAQYQPIPLGIGGRSVIIEGFTSGTAVPVSGTVAVTQSTSPWVNNITQAAGVNFAGQVAGSLPVTIVSGIGTIAGVPSTSLAVVDSQTVAIVDLMQTLILEIRAMRKAVVYMITENGDILDSDFEPSNQDFQPVN